MAPPLFVIVNDPTAPSVHDAVTATSGPPGTGVWVAVGVGEGVSVAVAVGVGVGVSVAVAVGVGEGVSVGVGVGVSAAAKAPLGTRQRQYGCPANGTVPEARSVAPGWARCGTTVTDDGPGSASGTAAGADETVTDARGPPGTPAAPTERTGSDPPEMRSARAQHPPMSMVEIRIVYPPSEAAFECDEILGRETAAGARPFRPVSHGGDEGRGAAPAAPGPGRPRGRRRQAPAGLTGSGRRRTLGP
ncbi:MAG: hypothetical protein EPN53_12810 [Acidobacteria bacterium]|nr:MAG: hypothetical protein EPN53_12810 [Acidobacteriota bacterium]